MVQGFFFFFVKMANSVRIWLIINFNQNFTVKFLVSVRNTIYKLWPIMPLCRILFLYTNVLKCIFKSKLWKHDSCKIELFLLFVKSLTNILPSNRRYNIQIKQSATFYCILTCRTVRYKINPHTEYIKLSVYFGYRNAIPNRSF